MAWRYGLFVLFLAWVDRALARRAWKYGYTDLQGAWAADQCALLPFWPGWPQEAGKLSRVFPSFFKLASVGVLFGFLAKTMTLKIQQAAPTKNIHNRIFRFPISAHIVFSKITQDEPNGSF
jgi:hypothetical protein